MNTRFFTSRLAKATLSTLFLINLFCVMMPIQAVAQSQGEVVSITRKAANEAAIQMMKSISPNTGQDADYELDYNTLIYDPYAKEIECKATLYWSAKEYVLSSNRNTCTVYGKLYIDLSKGKDKIRSRFIPINKNRWTEVCASSHWANVATGIAFYLSTR
ncbi:hypothetical protein [Porphyromonas endodontalis]|uniref:hypothetical protein n=1 Tax=Porphyromonas endodontalis TaxID=28124 RepID=UPI003C71725F